MSSSAPSNVTVILTAELLLGTLSSTLKVLTDALGETQFSSSQKHQTNILQKDFRYEASVFDTEHYEQ